MPLGQAKVIVNPAAGGGRTARKWPRIAQWLLEAGLAYAAEQTQYPGHGIELARSARAQGYDVVIAVGGDGTVNEVVNGLLDEGQGPVPALGMIGTGTGSDFRRAIGAPRNPRQACQRLAKRQKALVDAGSVECSADNRVKSRFFVNVAGVGFDGAVVKATQHQRKGMPGTLPYLMGLFRTLVSYTNRDILVNIDGQSSPKRVNSVIIANGSHFGGGMHIAPGADPADGELDVVMIGDVGRIELLMNLPRIYRGTHLTHPKVCAQRGRQVLVEADGLPVQTDGEFVGETPARFQILPRRLTIIT